MVFVHKQIVKIFMIYYHLFEEILPIFLHLLQNNDQEFSSHFLLQQPKLYAAILNAYALYTQYIYAFNN